MKYHGSGIRWLWDDEAIFLFGFATGRVSYEEEWLYSFRLFVGLVRLEILWRTKKSKPDMKCEVCDQGPPNGPSIYRVNQPGEMPARWRCEKHLTQAQKAAIGAETMDITKAIEGAH